MKKNIKWCGILLIISILIELLYFGYNICIDKIYTKLHFIGNNPVEISTENMTVEKDEPEYIYYNLNISPEITGKIYNVLLVCKEEHPENVYLRVKTDNSYDILFKSNPAGTEFNSYYLSGIDSQNLSVILQKNQLTIEGIEKIIVNSNVNFVNQANISLFRILIYYVICSLIYFIVEYRKNIFEKINKLKFENLILILLITFGLIFNFMNTPLDGYDEHGHFWRAYELSLGNIKSDPQNKLPNSVIDILFTEEGTYPNRDFDYANLLEKLKLPLNPEDERSFPVGATASYSLINYFPSVIGVFIARILELNPMIIFYIGRLANLISYITVIYFALKIVPNGRIKKIMGLISIFPMCLTLAASYSPDAIIISFTMLTIAYVLKLKFDSNIKEINIRHILIFSIFALIPTICKIVYLFLFGLIFLIPKEKFKNKYSRIIYFIFQIVFAIIGYYVFCNLLRGEGQVSIEKNSIEQLSYCLANPFIAINIFARTIADYSTDYLCQMIGGFNTPTILSIIIFIALLLVVFEKDDNDLKFEKKDKILLGVFSTLQILAVFAAMWVVWSTAKQTYIMGIQGRYFIPTLPLLLLAISSNIFDIKLKNKKVLYVCLMIITFLFCIYNSISKFI